jgi:predicted restriction endonuclease
MNKKILRQAGFSKEVEAVENNRCPICGAEIDPNDFRDELSKKEYGISGLCQGCQDDIFGY